MKNHTEYITLSKKDLLNYYPDDIIVLAKYFHINPKQPIHVLIDTLSKIIQKKYMSGNMEMSCSEDIEPIYQMEWDDDIRPDIKILFVNEKTNYTECYSLDNWKKYISLRENYFANWIPNANRPVDNEGRGGKPGNTILLKTPMNRFIVGFSHIHPNKSQNYIAIPIAEKKRIGNLDGIFGVGSIHGQAPGYTVYSIVPSYSFTNFPSKKEDKQVFNNNIENRLISDSESSSDIFVMDSEELLFNDDIQNQDQQDDDNDENEDDEDDEDDEDNAYRTYEDQDIRLSKELEYYIDEIDNMTINIHILHSSFYFSIDFHDIMDKLRITDEEIKNSSAINIYLSTENHNTHVLIKDINYPLSLDNRIDLLLNGDNPLEPPQLDIQSFSSLSNNTQSQIVYIEDEGIIQFVKKPLDLYDIYNIHSINTHLQFNIREIDNDNEVMKQNKELFNQNNINYIVE